MPLRVTGRVKSLYVRRDVTYISLDIPPDRQPQDGLFELQLTNANYGAQYSLALAAAANRWPLTVRIVGKADISPERAAVVNYLVVDWAAIER